MHSCFLLLLNNLLEDQLGQPATFHMVIDKQVTEKTLHTLGKDAGLATDVSADEMSLLYAGFTTSS